MFKIPFNVTILNFIRHVKCINRTGLSLQQSIEHENHASYTENKIVVPAIVNNGFPFSDLFGESETKRK